MNQQIIERLQKGETIEGYKESGNSMTSLIHHREPVTLSPVDASKIEVGDIVLAKVKGRFFLHLVKALDGDQVQIGNNHGHINGWTNRAKVYAIVTKVGNRVISKAATKIKC